MKKKICLILILCLILSLTVGCGPKKLEPFNMSANDMNKKVNENIIKLGYSVTVPEFTAQKDAKDAKNIDYTCDVNDDLSASIVQYSDSTYYIIVILMIPLQATNSEIDKNWDDFIAVSSAIIATVDPNSDIGEIVDGLKLHLTKTGTTTYQTDKYTYRSDTALASKTFIVTKK